MSAPEDRWTHGAVVAIGEFGVLARGASGSGKSRLAQALIAEGVSRRLFARLVADDRAQLNVRGGRVIARPHAAIAGLIEERGAGLLRLEYEPAVVLHCVVDLDAEADAPAPRLPEPHEITQDLLGVTLARVRLRRDISPPEGAQRVLGRLFRSRNEE